MPNEFYTLINRLHHIFLQLSTLFSVIYSSSQSITQRLRNYLSRQLVKLNQVIKIKLFHCSTIRFAIVSVQTIPNLHQKCSAYVLKIYRISKTLLKILFLLPIKKQKMITAWDFDSIFS